MPYDKHIDKTEEALRELRRAHESNEVDRFTDGLIAGRIDSEEKVIKFTNYIRESDGLTQLEYSRLKKLHNEGFIEKFATNYNKRYSTCHLLMNKMRSGISRGMNLLAGFCEKKRFRGKHKEKYKVANSSKMGNAPYNRSYWGLEYYKDSVRILYNEIVSYKKHLNECIDLCLYVIKQVEYIKSHPEIAYEMHQKNRRDVLLNNRSIIRNFIDLNAEMECELLEKVEAWKEKKKSMEEISAMLYHTLDENEYSEWIISEEVMEARRQGITNPERALWGDDKHQVMRYRAAYTHIDELNPAGQKEHIGGMFLAMLFKWSNVQGKRGVDYWLTYFTDFYTASGGKLTPVKIGAVKRCLTLITMEKVKQKDIDSFNLKMDNLVKKYMITHSDPEKEMKKAVNF